MATEMDSLMMELFGEDGEDVMAAGDDAAIVAGNVQLDLLCKSATIVQEEEVKGETDDDISDATKVYEDHQEITTEVLEVLDSPKSTEVKAEPFKGYFGPFTPSHDAQTAEDINHLKLSFRNIGFVRILVGQAENLTSWYFPKTLIQDRAPRWIQLLRDEKLFLNLEPHVFAHVAGYLVDRGIWYDPEVLHGDTCSSCPHQVDFCKLYSYAFKAQIPQLQAWSIRQIFSCMGRIGDEYLDPTALNWLWNDHRLADINHEPIILWRNRSQIDSTCESVVWSSDNNPGGLEEATIATKPWHGDSFRRRALLNATGIQPGHPTSGKRVLRPRRGRKSKAEKLAEAAVYVKQHLLGSLGRDFSKLGFETALSDYLVKNSGLDPAAASKPVASTIKSTIASKSTKRGSNGIKIRIQVPRKRVPPPDLSQGPANMKLQIEFCKLAFRILQINGKGKVPEYWKENKRFMEFYIGAKGDENWPILWEDRLWERDIGRYERDDERWWGGMGSGVV